jgi:hypothetical protein
MVPGDKGNGLLMDLEEVFDVKHKPSVFGKPPLFGIQDDRKPSDTETSMANAETEDDEVSFLTKKAGASRTSSQFPSRQHNSFLKQDRSLLDGRQSFRSSSQAGSKQGRGPHYPPRSAVPGARRKPNGAMSVNNIS